MPTLVILIVVLLYIAHQLTMTVLLMLAEDGPKLNYKNKISILVAARNEEDNILACLQSLYAQKHPPELLDVHIGDDDSTDNTARLIKDFIADKPNFHYHRITKTLPKLRGKQNVLAQLAYYADGDYLLITDADVIHTKYWAGMLSGGFTSPNVGIVTAATLVSGQALQGLDWLMGITIMKVYSTYGLPISPVGNNMAVSREAYDATGGYENIPFSITEDYKLWEAVKAKGYSMRWRMNPWLLVLSEPIRSFQKFIAQRKRWFKGGRSGPMYAVASFLLSVLAHLGLVVLPFVGSLEVFIYLVLAKILAELSLVVVASQKIGQLRLLLWFLPYQLYYLLNLLFYMLYFPLPGKVDWKGRKY